MKKSTSKSACKKSSKKDQTNVPFLNADQITDDFDEQALENGNGQENSVVFYREGNIFQPSSSTIVSSKHVVDSPQSRSPSYDLAFDDVDFLLKDEQRAVRLQLEWAKPDQYLIKHKIKHTWVIFGSARIRPADYCQQKIDDAQQVLSTNPNNEKALRQQLKYTALLKKSSYYDEATKLCRMLSDEKLTGVEATVITGGGQGIMEAANKGAYENGKETIGLNIVLPTEQSPNPYITPELCFQFHYFAIRKMHFLMRAKAIVAFPGGFGTLDELLETLTLMQTDRICPMPIILFGEEYWNKVINFNGLLEEGMISEKDLSLFHFVKNSEEAINIIAEFYRQ